MVKASNKYPLISVIIPVYKVEQYIDECVQSVINQTYKNLEIILVDDGSPDSCGEICDNYAKKDNRIKVIHKKNGGLSDARNVGIEIAKGEFIGFIDSDDMISNKMYETLYTLITDYNADISCCDLIRFSDTIPQIKNKKNICIYNQEEYLKLYFKINSQSCEYYAVTKLYKRSVLENENFPLNLTAEDVLGTYKTILKANTIVKTDEILYYYRKNAESITGKFTEKDMDLICIWDKVVELTQKKAPKYLEYAILNRKRINFTLLMRMAINMNKKELKENELVLKLLNELKKDEKNLLRSPITLNRKILIFLFCRNYYFFAKIIRILKGGN